MLSLRKETMKKNIFLLSIISTFVFITGEDSLVKFTINERLLKLVVQPVLVFFVTFALYKRSKICRL